MHRLRAVLVAQGTYYVATGAVPFVSRRAFEAVTGPKREWWLVQMVAALAVVIGAVLLQSSRRPHAPPTESATLAAGSALAFAGVDVVYVSRGRIAPTYLLDAAAQLGFLAALATSAREEGFEPPTSSSGGRRSIH